MLFYQTIGALRIRCITLNHYRTFHQIINNGLKHLHNNEYHCVLKNKKSVLSSLQNITYKCATSRHLSHERKVLTDVTINNCNKYTNRSHNCGELRTSDVGKCVCLCGWIEYHRMNKFIILRDSYGEIQVIIPDDKLDLKNMFKNLSYESIVQVDGVVSLRPTDMINSNQKTGEIEVTAVNVHLLNVAKSQLPFNIREFQKAKEALRMQYRYLDLRFSDMQNNLRVRSKVLMDMRDYLINFCDFVDVETPTLFRATPGGAQEFVVPTRFPGQFYSLVQSPQQLKQLLMVGSIDRYFQIARCYRDEGARSDRQPEFTQLDLEMSFTTVNGVLRLIEELLQFAWPKYLKPLVLPFRRLSYREAMDNYGSDKPDLRYDYRLQNCTVILETNPKLVFRNDFGAYFLRFPHPYASLTKTVKEIFSKLSMQYPQTKLVQSKVVNKKEWIKKYGNLLTENVAETLADKMELSDSDVVFLAFGNSEQTVQLLGNIRTQYVDLLETFGHEIKNKEFLFSWIVDFPLFEQKETGEIVSVHHPFTAPNPNDVHLLATNPLKVRSEAYDLVLNGNEVGGGSIRIHNAEMQAQILDILRIDTRSMQYFLEALETGCPPHGGIALGLDRLIACILNCKSIRDVIAFPKGLEGRDLMTGAPVPLSISDKKLYHIETVEEK